jgi:3,4-dihydroxy 2-butanone 4-phosphate synthase/GTP cyclohydrolase II
VLCELVNDDGTMQRLPQLLEFKQKFGLKMISIEQLIAYRLKKESLVEKIGEGPVESSYGRFTAHVFQSRIDKRHHIALTMGEFEAATPALVRVQSSDVLADVFRVSGGGGVLDKSLKAIAAEGRGAVLYMESASFKESLLRQLRPKRAGEEAPPSMDLRDYGIGAQILRSLGLKRIRLMTQQPRKLVGLDAYGIELVEQLEIRP